MPSDVIHLDGESTPAQRRRRLWAENLRDQMEAQSVSVKQMHRAMLDEGVDVTTQAIYSWLKGDTSPRPETQIVVAQVLRTKASVLFPVVAA